MGKTSSFGPKHLTKIAFQFAMVLVPVGLCAVTLGARVSAGAVADSIDVKVSPVRTNDGGSNDTNTTTLFRAHQDNARNHWKWTPENGWQLDVIEETYQNGWAWTWRDGEWHWEQGNPDGSAPVAASSEISSEASSTASVDAGDAQCFDEDGALTSDSGSCAADQKEAAAKADVESLPADMQSIARDTAPLTPDEETEVQNIMQTNFDADVVGNQKSTVVRAASDVVTRLGTLKDLDSVTDTERRYFVAKIAEAQKIISEIGNAVSREDIVAATDTLENLVKEVGDYASSRAIAVTVPNAPSAAKLLSDAHRIIDAVPATFGALEGAGYSTQNLRSMLDQTVILYADVSIKCTQGRDCSKVSDVVDQLGKTITTLNDMVFASGNSKLTTDVQTRFDKALKP